MYYNDIRALIGNTPLLKLNHLGIQSTVSIFAKLELFNPGGSVKDRIGLSMIEKAEKEGLLKPGMKIIEATAGNTGIGIALAALNKGYEIIFTVPEKFSIEKITLMKALGAKVVMTPRDAGMEGAIALAQKMVLADNQAISLLQFENSANPEIHYHTTGREIFEALNMPIDYFIAGAGSGGTVTGVSKFLKEKYPAMQTVVADPLGSTMGGGKAGCYQIEGIGNHFIPETMDMHYIDAFEKVTDEEAFFYVKELALKEGLLVGTSSAAALALAVRLAHKMDRGNIVTLFPDRGDRYLSKEIYK